MRLYLSSLVLGYWSLLRVTVYLARGHRRTRFWVAVRPFVRSASKWPQRLAGLASVAVPLSLSTAGFATPLVELHPCPALERLGAMDENGVVSRPVTARQLAADMVRLTQSQHDRLVEAVRRIVWLPERTRYEQHQLVSEQFASDSPLNFHSELGGINPDEVYLLGLSRETESPRTAHFGPLHTFLFWGREAQDIAAALRNSPD